LQANRDKFIPTLLDQMLPFIQHKSWVWFNCSRPNLGHSQPSIQWVAGWLGRQADNSYPSSAEDRNAWDLVKYRTTSPLPLLY